MTNLREFAQNWIAAFNRRGGLEDYLTFYDDAVTIHGFPPGIEGKAGLRIFYSLVQAAIPDWTLIPDDLICEDNKIAARYRLEGTHQGELMGFPGTGRRVSINAQTIAHLRDGKVIERWQAVDEVGMARQLQS